MKMSDEPKLVLGIGAQDREAITQAARLARDLRRCLSIIRRKEGEV